MAVCLEPSHGRLIDALLQYAHVVLDPRHPRMLATFRDAFAPRGQHDDPTAAQRFLALVRKHREQRKRWRPADEHTRTLQCVVAHRRTLVTDNTRLTNRFTRVLNGDVPHVLGGFAALDTPCIGDVLTRWPTLPAVQQTDDATLRTFFQAHQAHHGTMHQRRMAGMRQAIPATTDQAVIRAAAMRVHALVEHVGCLPEAIARFDKALDARTRSPADVPMVASWPGAGPVHPSRLISALGPDRRRSEHGEDGLTFTGMAPVIERRGNMTVTHFRWLCPTGLRPSCHACAGQSLQHSRWAKACYHQQRRRGKEHHAAVRSLALTWASMIFPLWNKRRPYREPIDGAALPRRGSPLWPVMAAQQA
jgi:hypothetical protein